MKKIISIQNKLYHYKKKFIKVDGDKSLSIRFILLSSLSKGKCVVNYSDDNPANRKNIQLGKFDDYHVPVGKWHQITNPFDETCHLIEIQYGEACVEEDIERVDYYKPQ